MNLYDAFDECLSLKNQYTNVENDGDFFIKQDGDTLKIFFEWSDSKKDWKNNFSFFAIPWKPYKSMKKVWLCHRGFLKVWKSIEPYIVKDIMNPEVHKIEIVGYSHGAAIALLCYEYCIFNRPDCEIQGAGFGCPRVFWGFVRKSLKEKFKNFTVVRNGKDIVTHVPPVIFGFRHISPVVKIGKSNPIKDHYPELYLTHLKGVEQ